MWTVILASKPSTFGCSERIPNFLPKMARIEGKKVDLGRFGCGARLSWWVRGRQGVLPCPKDPQMRGHAAGGRDSEEACYDFICLSVRYTS